MAKKYKGVYTRAKVTANVIKNVLIIGVIYPKWINPVYGILIFLSKRKYQILRFSFQSGYTITSKLHLNLSDFIMNPSNFPAFAVLVRWVPFSIFNRFDTVTPEPSASALRVIPMDLRAVLRSSPNLWSLIFISFF